MSSIKFLAITKTLKDGKFIKFSIILILLDPNSNSSNSSLFSKFSIFFILLDNR